MEGLMASRLHQSTIPVQILVNKIPQVAERLNVSVRTIYYLIESGQLKKVKIGRKASGILESALIEFVRNLKMRNE
jgi:excisionase family DNA binding protein